MGKNFDIALKDAAPLIKKYLNLIAPRWKKDSSQEPHCGDLLIIARDLAIKQGELQGSIKLDKDTCSKAVKAISLYRPIWQEGEDAEIFDKADSEISIFLESNGYLTTYLGFSEHHGGMGVVDLEVFQLTVAIAVEISRSQEKFLECWSNPKDFLKQFEPQLKQVAPKLGIELL